MDIKMKKEHNKTCTKCGKIKNKKKFNTNKSLCKVCEPYRGPGHLEHLINFDRTGNPYGGG
jgi:hypothetical protein